MHLYSNDQLPTEIQDLCRVNYALKLYHAQGRILFYTLKKNITYHEIDSIIAPPYGTLFVEILSTSFIVL